MNTYMGRVRLIIGDGTCAHYGQVDYIERFCIRCNLWFLACPKCHPIYCPICIVEKKNSKKKVIQIGVKSKGLRWTLSKKARMKNG